MGDGERRSVILAPGVARLVAQEGAGGTSWAGLWYSLDGTAQERRLVLDPARAFPGSVRESLQAQVVSWSLRARGRGTIKIELRSPSDGLLDERRSSLQSTGFTTISGPIPADVGPLKLLNVVVDAPADITIDEITLHTRVPRLDPLCTAFLYSYAQLMRAYDPVSGRVKDHAQWPIADFDNVPATGFVALAAAAAADLAVVTREDARQIARHALGATLASPREPTSGWLPHWLKDGRRHPSSEWSTVDTALALVPALEAATMLDLRDERKRLRKLVDSLSFAAVTRNGRISHGLDAQGRLIRSFWDAWGGETSVVEVLRAYQNPRLPEITAARRPPAYCGRGFITELTALFFREFGAPGAGADKWGVDWYRERKRQYEAQRAYARGSLLFGESPAEVISADGSTAYVEAGVGTRSPRCAPLDNVPGFGSGDWRMPHYIAMTAALDPVRTARSVRRMLQLGLLPPLGGPAESVLVGADDTVHRWHSAQISLNAFFNVIGYYHAIVRRDRRADAIYDAARADDRLRAALATRFGKSR